MAMKAGKLRHLVTIERPVKVRAASGDFITTWDTFLEDVYASIEPLKGKELFHAQTVNADATHTVQIRFADGVNADMRVVYKGRYLQIADVPINDCECDEMLTFLCIEKT